MDNIKLTPTLTFISRTVNGHTYRIWVDAYVDEEGEIYYKGSILKQVEEQIKEMEDKKNLTNVE